ncbi:Hypothetical protein CINCED_3A020941 [Cinara cedri]|uniref:Reverse transcriptase domain n=1 Tax=Cinara cedri TaxID=506608 RepID=A0A5E4M3E0_9HEMI|nr:Hypothetical protein CINCED_3A020941 [Cinara cedri]
MFADDTVIMKTNEDQQTATEWLQSEKSVHVNHTLRKTVYKPVLLDQQTIKHEPKRSELDLTSKRLLYAMIIKPIWTYGIQLWGCVNKSNIEIIQRCQNIALHTIIAAYRYDKNCIHRDKMITFVQDEISKFALKHEKKLDQHTNPAAI